MKYAIVESGGKQFKAVEGGLLEVDRLPVEPGASVKLDQVLLLADGDNVTVGKPLVKDNPVWTKVVEHFKGPKVTIFNYRPKKRIRVRTGHRQNYTRLLVEQVGGTTLMPRKEPEKAAKPEAEKAAKPARKEKAAETVKPELKESQPARAAAKEKASGKPAKAAPKGKPAQEKKPASKGTAAKGKAAPAKKPADKQTAAKKPAGKSPAK